MIKAEGQSVQLDGWVKSEPDSLDQTLASAADEDIYEDAGDLDFSGAAQPIYLTRLPKDLWERWNALGDDEEVTVGTIRIEGDLRAPKRVSLMLSPDVENTSALPKEYNLQFANSASGNTFVFNEKDLPGYSVGTQNSHTHTHEGAGSVNGAPRSNPRPGFQDRARNQLQNSGRNKRWHPYQRRTIPKQTAIVGCVQKDLNCLPVENAQYQRYIAEKNRNLLKADRGTVIVSDLNSASGNLLAPGTSTALNKFTNFTKSTGTSRGKAQETKAARMPQNELLDLIQDCFKEYRYWPMKSIKARLNQPETYLRSTLEMIAILVKQGPHSGTWQLRPDAQISHYENANLPSLKDEAAPEVGDGDGEGMDSDTKDLEDFEDDDNDDDDEENTEMVDAL